MTYPKFPKLHLKLESKEGVGANRSQLQQSTQGYKLASEIEKNRHFSLQIAT